VSIGSGSQEANTGFAAAVNTDSQAGDSQAESIEPEAAAHTDSRATSSAACAVLV
jgi:hypothetical protein